MIKNKCSRLYARALLTDKIAGNDGYLRIFVVLQRITAE